MKRFFRPEKTVILKPLPRIQARKFVPGNQYPMQDQTIAPVMPQASPKETRRRQPTSWAPPWAFGNKLEEPEESVDRNLDNPDPALYGFPPWRMRRDNTEEDQPDRRRYPFFSPWDGAIRKRLRGSSPYPASHGYDEFPKIKRGTSLE